MKLAVEKKRLIAECLTRYLGHEPSAVERSEFTISHYLTVVSIYHKGKFVEEFSLEMQIFNDLFEYAAESQA